MLPIYLPSEEHKKMTDKNLYLAKSLDNTEVEWVIVETGSNFYEDEAGIYIHEETRTTPNISCNKGFKACSGKYVVFLSNDIVTCKDWIIKMKECFDRFKDCGIASLGNNESFDVEENSIVEGIFFSVCMMKKEDAWFDANYNRVFDDTDLLFRLYLQDKKFYKNLSGLIYHKPHSTLGQYAGDVIEFERSKKYFEKKYENYKHTDLYKRFTQ
jgi:GT2 family glycosyltransferase